MTQTYYFDKDYQETVILKDGAAVLRLVLPSDKDLLVHGMEHLSARSRYYRFFAAKKILSQKDLCYFTEIDGLNHFAIGALRQTEKEDDQGLGVARFIRFTERSDAAEFAITVIDEIQGKGLGHILLLRLVAAARERGILTFHADVLADNKPMISLLRKVAPHGRAELDGGVLEFELSLADVAPGC